VFGVVLWFITSEPRGERAAGAVSNVLDKLFGGR